MFRNKLRSLVSILLIFVTLLTGCTSARKSEIAIISNDVLSDSILQDNSSFITSDVLIDLEDDVNYRDILGIRDNNVLIRRDNKLFSLNIESKENGEIIASNPLEISKDSSKLLYLENRNLFLYDFKKDFHKLLLENISDPFEMYANISFADLNGDYVYCFDSNTKSIQFIEVYSGITKLIDLSDPFKSGNYTFPTLRVYGNNIYISIRNESTTAFYKVDSAGSVREYLKLPHKQDMIVDFTIINEGNHIIFNGYYNNEPGIFIYDIIGKAVSKLVSGGKSKEGSWVPFYSISPSSDKIVFDIDAGQFQGEALRSIYLAEIKENNLANITRILEKEAVPAVVSLISHWSTNSENLYIKKSSSSLNPSRVIQILEIK